jgi:Fe-S cluster assembly iron-binding protein IscA
VTPQALEVVRRSLELAGADANDMGVRLRIAGGTVRPRFVATPEDEDEVVEAEGIRVFIARSIIDKYGEVEVDVTPEHETLTVRSIESDA